MDDFPDPPVPVIPRTGTLGNSGYTLSNAFEKDSASFSAAVIVRAMSRMFLSPNRSMAPSKSSMEGTVS